MDIFQTLSYSGEEESLLNLSIRLMSLHSAANNDETISFRKDRFMSVVGSYEGIINRICYSFSMGREDFDDLRQDILINIWNGIDSFREDSSMATWIYRVAFNTCVSTIRKSARNHKVKESLFNHFEDTEPDADRDDIEKLHYMISLLNPEDKAVILLWLDERPYEEIGEIMGWPRNTVATRLRRAKEKLTVINKSDKI